MFHSANVHMVQRARRPNALRTYIASSSIIPGKEPFRRGVLFSTVAGIIMIVGGLLTWMGFNDVFRGRASMMGPLLIALSLLLMFFSTRQFLIARKQTRRAQAQIRCRDAITAMLFNREDGIGAVTVIMDAVDMSPDTTWRSNHSVEYAPPSYNEVLGQSYTPSSSSARQPSPTDQDFELPPTYDEAVAALNCRQVVVSAPNNDYAEFIGHACVPTVSVEPVSSPSPPISPRNSNEQRYPLRPRLQHQESIDEESDDPMQEEFPAVTG